MSKSNPNFMQRPYFYCSLNSSILSFKCLTCCSRSCWIISRSFILVACVLFWREIVLRFFRVSFFVSFIWVFNCLAESNSRCNNAFFPSRVWYLFLYECRVSLYVLTLSPKSWLASKLFSSSALFSRCFDSSAAFNWSASSVFFFQRLF